MRFFWKMCYLQHKLKKNEKKSDFFGKNGKSAIYSTNWKKMKKMRFLRVKWKKCYLQAILVKKGKNDQKMEKVLFIGHFGKKREKWACIKI